MTDPTTAPTEPPALLATLIHDYSQKALTSVGAGLLAHGLVSQAQSDQLIQLGVGTAAMGLSIAWTYFAARFRRSRLAAAIAAPAVR